MPYRQIIQLLGISLLLLSGCSLFGMNVPVGAEPLLAVESDSPLCKMYKQYELLKDPNSDCDNGRWSLKLADRSDTESVNVLTVARNEFQHALLSKSTTLCNEFKGRYVHKSTRSVVGSESLSILFSAASVATGHATIAKSLAAAAGASNAVSGLFEDRYSGDADMVLSGIEVERTRIFKQIQKGQTKTVIEYPVNQAVNDAIRYHAVCNMVEGQNAAESAVKDAADG